MKQILTKQQTKQQGLAIVSGIIFGLGLGLSQMIDRQRVLGFLDLAGTWDPTLLFVLLSAVGVTVIAFRFVLHRHKPIFARSFSLPSRKDIDGRLITGAAIFGVGWGISGYCPGPGIAALVMGSWNPVLFLLAMVTGMVVFNRYDANQRDAATAPAEKSVKSL
ncbi:MAG: DUF6691 family protein [Phormidesmis sp.]